MRVISDGVYEISGRSEIVRINEMFDLDIPESDEYQTLAGYIMSSTGAIPDVGEPVMLDDMKLTVITKTDTRLELIKVEDLRQKSEAKSESN